MKNINQTGFGAVEAVLVTIIIGIIAGAGWFVYQSQNINKQPIPSTDRTESSSKETKYLEVKEWGIKFQFQDDTPADVYYKIKDVSSVYGQPAQELNLFTPQQSKLDPACETADFATLHLIRSEAEITNATAPTLPAPRSVAQKYHYFIGDKSGGSCVVAKEDDSAANNPKMAESDKINAALFKFAQTLQSN